MTRHHSPPVHCSLICHLMYLQIGVPGWRQHYVIAVTNYSDHMAIVHIHNERLSFIDIYCVLLCGLCDCSQ